MHGFPEWAGFDVFFLENFFDTVRNALRKDRAPSNFLGRPNRIQIENISGLVNDNAVNFHILLSRHKRLGYIWIGMAFGTYVLARYLAPMLYRSGVVTNAEFLELRFTRSMRLASALIQILYRFIAMALVGYALATMFKVVMGVDMTYGILISMCITILYVFASGQLGVVMAAVPQVALMLVVSGIVFFSVFADLGGMGGFVRHLPDYGEMMHLTYYTEDGLNNSLYLWGLILVLFTYPLVNQTVAQRIVSAASESDARKGSMISLLPWFIVTGVAIMAGVVGTVLVPDLPADQRNDLYPL